MSDSVIQDSKPPPEQQAIRDKCFHQSGTFAEFPIEDVETSIPERFEKIVRTHGDRIAIQTQDHRVSYGELHESANRVARRLVTSRGEEPEAIALLLNKDSRLMAAMLGVLKARKYFVLLDSSFPRARNVALLEDSRAFLVIADRENVAIANNLVTTPSCVLQFESIDASISAEELGLEILPEAFATILYTSGSTGEPKGVLCDHRDLLHRAMLRGDESRVCESDRIALLPTGTANAVTNIFFALLNGAVLCPFDIQKEGVIRLSQWLEEERITICAFSSSLFRTFAATMKGNEAFPDLRIVRLRSESVHQSDIGLYRKLFSQHCKFVTGLSTSESGQLTSCILNDNFSIQDDGVPIGYPVRDKEILILDDDGNDVGVNQVGEIVVRSRYLAVGYWRRPEITEMKFKADLSGNDRRFCFTGDLGLRRPDGCLVHKGRKDFRVKIRGYGVELAEVERRLLDHREIKEAVVVARESSFDVAHLVAYCTVHKDSSPRVSELRNFLQLSVPDYMIPSAFMIMDAMPLTSNGKIDRSALPSPQNRRPDLETIYTPPGTPNDEILVKILSGLLGIEPIGIDDNFFDLGGHSLLATQFISRIRDAFRVDIPLTKFLEAPTVFALGKFIDQSDPARRDFKDLPIQHAARTGALPISFAQQRLWFLDQLFPQGFAYNMLSAYKLKGNLNVPVLKDSVNEIVKRHEIWRTVFVAIDGVPRQIVLPKLTLDLPVVDLREATSDADRDSELSRCFKTEAQTPFDLAHGPLVRVKLLRLSGDEYVLLLVKHHIVYDGWSRGIIERELTALYEAFADSRPSPLKELPIQYSDYSVWQQQWFQGAMLDEQLLFWKRQLDNSQALHLPADHPRPPIQSHRGERHYFVLSTKLTTAVKQLSKDHGVTLYMCLLAGFKTLLHRYSGQTDIVVGFPIAGRNRSELENLIGFFLNTLPLRTDLSRDPTFAHVVARVRDVCVAAYTHQDLPFEKIIEEVRPERNLSHNPIFQVAFTLQNTPRSTLELPGVNVEELEVFTGITRFDLELYLEEIGNELRGYLNYNTDLFDETTMIRMLGHFKTLLEGIVANPELRISELPLLSEAEKHQLLGEWNKTKAEYPRDKCIQQLFEEQVERVPEAVAVVFEGEQLTYRELNHRANRLAHHLQKLGVGPDVLVGICMERSLEMIVGLLGILKAGGAYVPLDPAYPKERLGFMLEDSRVSILVTQKRLAALHPTDNLQVVYLDGEVRKPNSLDSSLEKNPASRTASDNLAYVIYTSGSTGQPKGTLITHHNVVRLFQATEDWCRFNSSDVWTQFHSYAFDFSVWEIWGALLYGGKLVVVPHEICRSPKEFAALLIQERVTVLNQTPSAFYQLMPYVTGSAPGNSMALRLVVFGGEALNVQNLKPWFERRGDENPQLINMYGITETTVHVTYRPITKADIDSAPGSVIGKPIPDLRVYLLDKNKALVPIGVAGEIYVGGAGVAKGYLERDELTVERFVSDPFGNDPQAKLYRSGDLARYLPDGNIEFLGRIDDQVKIRGYRIELGEIEAVLGQHRSVREAVVLVREDSPGDKRLVAYGVSAPGAVPTASELRSFLQQKLPDYMVPSAFVFLNELPLTPNGKVDRKALPVPDQSRPELNEGYVGPRSVTEQRLAQIWSEVLKVERVGVHDNFFHLGGHSLLAIRLISLISKEFEREVALRSFFESPTIEGVAKYLEAGDEERDAIDASGNHKWLCLFKLKNGDNKSPVYVFPGGFGGENEALALAQIAHFVGPEYPFFGLRAKSSQGNQRAHQSVEEMARDFLKEIRSIQPKGPYHLLGHCLGGVIAYEVACQLQDQGEEVGLLGFLDTSRPTKALYYRYLGRRVIEKLIPNWQFYYRERASYHMQTLRGLDWRGKIGYIARRSETLKEVFDLQTTQAAADSRPTPSLREFRDNQSSHISTLLRYRPRQYRGRVFSLVAEEKLKRKKDGTLGWGKHVSGKIEVRSASGNHDSFIRDHTETVGNLVRSWLATVA